ncbi:MAG: hypothetical protein V1792_14085 [Pseudomonadota bacterium]
MKIRILVLVTLATLMLAAPFGALGGEGGDDNSARPVMPLGSPIHR